MIIMLMIMLKNEHQQQLYFRISLTIKEMNKQVEDKNKTPAAVIMELILERNKTMPSEYF